MPIPRDRRVQHMVWGSIIISYSLSRVHSSFSSLTWTTWLGCMCYSFILKLLLIRRQQAIIHFRCRSLLLPLWSCFPLFANKVLLRCILFPKVIPLKRNAIRNIPVRFFYWIHPLGERAWIKDDTIAALLANDNFRDIYMSCAGQCASYSHLVIL